ncbi:MULTISPECIES: aldose epimerase family protein [Mediterranea]|uniref:aldose epimerase family protein n=1 Tax=Mediterranea TaxID=1926659 RepID=UPI0020134508|nr:MULTISPECIES: aldose epimerase family protein [Mediterranea]MCL1607468.1 galactose mutarotase [Mediterranea sp. ET5]MDM8122355.1 aldose epimerase family protein [Mediterranea massiliensis]MDM8198794.1 aldose epimerase family protein [Mediterranea massiliensis]
MKTLSKLLFAGACMATFACTPQQEALTQSGLNPKNFQAEVNGKQTQLYTLTNANGMEVCITNFGGRIVSIMVPDKNGEMKDVVLGFDSIADYINVPSDFGAAIGRYANRINQGKLVLDGDTIQLPQNNYGHCLHGGPTGWQYQVYAGQQVNDSTLQLTMQSPDGDNNFPGNVTAHVTYTLKGDNSIDIKYDATTDKKTVINMTNHSYFNLSGNPQNTITDNILYVNADSITPVDSTFMTTGEMLALEDNSMNFKNAKSINEGIDMTNEQVKFGMGIDHNYVLNTKGNMEEVAARVVCPSTGITLEVYTDEPGIQVYTGNFLDGTVTGKKGIVYQQRVGLCLESQHYPDSPNKPQWPSVILEPGQTYQSHCIFKFGVEK